MKAEVSSVEKFMDKYNYAILKSAATEKMNGAPVVNERGQIIGNIQRWWYISECY